MSFAERLGLPTEFQTTLLVISVLLAASPYLSGVTVASLKVPKLAERQRRLMKVVGPLAVLACLGLVLPLPAEPPAATQLELVAVDFTDEGLIDVVIGNRGRQAAVITSIELEVLAIGRTSVRPPLAVAAAYTIPVDDLGVGRRRVALARHVVPPGGNERVAIAPLTTRTMSVRLHVRAGRGLELTRDVQLWPPKPGERS